MTFAAALVAVLAFAPLASAAGTTALAAPADFRVASNTAEAITLDWDSVSGDGVYYELYNDDQEYPYWVPTSTWEFQRNDAMGFEPGTTHTFRVRAGDQQGNLSEFATLRMTWADGDVTPPTAPTDLRVVSETASGWNIAWDPSTDDSGRVFYTVNPIGAAGSYGLNVGDRRTAFVPREDPIIGQIRAVSVVANDFTGQNPSTPAVLNLVP